MGCFEELGSTSSFTTDIEVNVCNESIPARTTRVRQCHVM